MDSRPLQASHYPLDLGVDSRFSFLLGNMVLSLLPPRGLSECATSIMFCYSEEIMQLAHSLERYDSQRSPCRVHRGSHKFLGDFAPRRLRRGVTWKLISVFPSRKSELSLEYTPHLGFQWSSVVCRSSEL